MPTAGHVYVRTHAPATTLVVGLRYGAALDIYDVLAGQGKVEAVAEFRAIFEPASASSDTITMANATPEYLANLASQLQQTLNEFAFWEPEEFIDAMLAAGTAEEVGAAVWAEVQEVYGYLTGPQTTDYEFTCIEVDVSTPGSGDP